ncbi:MAG: hypothetical protein ACO1N9_03305 [Flavobacterium sp.]
MKKFLKIFGIVILFEIVLNLAAILLKESGVAVLSSVGSWVSALLALPLSLVDRSYPYWALGGAGFSIMLILITFLTHTFFGYMFYRLLKTLVSK